MQECRASLGSGALVTPNFDAAHPAPAVLGNQFDLVVGSRLPREAEVADSLGEPLVEGEYVARYP